MPIRLLGGVPVAWLSEGSPLLKVKIDIRSNTPATAMPTPTSSIMRRRRMELVGVGIAVAGVLLLMSIFTFSNGDPSLNHATGTPPNNLMGMPGAYISDLLLQTFGLAIVLVPVAL